MTTPVLNMKREGEAWLYAPELYITATPEVRAQVCNGCGPGGWKVDIIPDTIWGLCITESCNVHDWMYATGATIADKEEADRVFLNNVLRQIDAAGGCSLLRKLRRARAKEYYEAVHLFGGPAFWSNVNPITNMMPVA